MLVRGTSGVISGFTPSEVPELFMLSHRKFDMALDAPRQHLHQEAHRAKGSGVANISLER